MGADLGDVKQRVDSCPAVGL
jgi:hypothetical protein